MTAILLPSLAQAQVEQILQDAIVRSSKAKDLTGLQAEVLQTTLTGTGARLIRTITSCLAASTDDGLSLPGTAEPQPPLSPYLRPLPAPPVDAEVLDLQAQLTAACQRVAELRATVPTQLAQRLTEHLQQCRPTSKASESPALASPVTVQWEIQPAAVHPEAQHEDAVSADLLAACQEDVARTAPLSPAPADLQSMYAAAVQRMPALRAKLEEALERMDRVVLAVERDSVQASPYTADLAIQLTDKLATDSVSPALQQALQSGKVVTRRHLKDVNPVPYAA